MALRQATASLVLIAGFTLLSVAPISAATPGFELEADVAGSTVQVTVRFEPVPAGFAWGSLESSGVLDELVGLMPANRVDDDGRPITLTEPIPIRLHRSDEGIYRGTAEVAEGRWAVVAWPLDTGFATEADPGTPATQFVEVGGGPPWVWLAVGGGAGLVMAAWFVGAIRRWKRFEKGG